MPAFAYKRVSTVDQATDRQLADLDIHFEKIFEDKASGKDTHRPELERMIEHLREGDTLYIHSLDRLARNLVDLQKTVDLLTTMGVEIYFVKEGLSFGRNSQQPALNKLMFQMLGAFAEFERNLIKERQREGIEQAKKSGVYKGRKPIEIKLFNQTLELVNGGMKTTEAIKQTGIKPATYYRYLSKNK